MNWKTKSAAAIVAGGLFGAAEAQAQPLNTNLVQNPSFETGPGTNADIWTGALATYSYSQNYTLPGPAGAGARYWHGGGLTNGSPGSLTATQTLNLVSAGFTPALLDSGLLRYNLSSFFSSYRVQGDFGQVGVAFLDAGNTVLGNSSTIGGDTFTMSLLTGANSLYPDAKAWGQDSTAGTLPVGTRSVLVTLTGNKVPSGASVDGYIDLVDFRLSAVPEPSTFVLVGGVGLVTAVFRARRGRRPGGPPATA